MLEKSENFNSLRPILFELCKKKLQGGVKLTPPPSRNRVKYQIIQNLLYPSHTLEPTPSPLKLLQHTGSYSITLVVTLSPRKLL